MTVKTRVLGESHSRAIPLLLSLLLCWVMLPTAGAAATDAAEPAVLRLGLVFELFSGVEVRIVAVDGEKFDGQAKVSEGEHLVTMSYATLMPVVPLIGVFIPYWWKARDCMVPLTTRAGHRYVAEVELMNEQSWNCWVRDEDTDEKFRGTLSAQEPTMEGAE